MNNEPIDILSNNNNNINDQKIMDYLNNKLSAEEKIEIDKLIAESALMSDVVQGLQEFKDSGNLSIFVDQLNAGLQKQLQKKKQRRQKLTLKSEQWTYLAVIIILLLGIIGFIIIRGLNG